MSRAFLIDGNSYAYKAYYALPPLRDSKGRITSALYGFTNMLMRVLREERPDYMAVAFERPAPSVRTRGAFKYNVRHPRMSLDLRKQISLIKQVVRAFNVPIFEVEGYDADDILGTIAKAMDKKGIEVFIVTSDRAVLQLVCGRIKVLNPHQDNLVYDEDMILKRLKVKPNYIPDLLSLMGEESENILGIPGVGEKLAQRLVNQFGNLNTILKSLDKMPEKYRELLMGYKVQTLYSLKIATIDTNVPFDFDIETCKIKEFDRDKLIDLFKRFEFTKFLSYILPHRHPTSVKYVKVMDKQALTELLKKLRVSSEFSIDTEATSPDAMTAQLVGISFSFSAWQGYYIPLAHNYDSCRKQLSIKFVMEALKRYLEDPNKKKIGQNIKYDAVLLSRYGIDLRGISFDTMVAAFLLNPLKSSHSLESLALEFLNFKMIPLRELLGTKRSIAEIDIGLVTEYACEDADLTLQLKGVLEEKLLKADLTDYFKNIEIPLLHSLIELENTGFKLDAKIIKKIIEELDSKASQSSKEIFKEVGYEFNLNSSRKVAEALFEKLKIPSKKLTKEGIGSISTEALLPLRKEYKAVEKILEYRAVNKTISNLLSVITYKNLKTKRIYPSYSQTFLITGRLNSSKPNLANLFQQEQSGTDVLNKIYKSIVSGAGKIVIYITLPNLVEIIQRSLAISNKNEDMITTILGRRVRLPDLRSSNSRLRKDAQKQAIMIRIEGSAADIVRFMLIKIKEGIRSIGLKTKIIFQVNYDIFLESPEQEREKNLFLLKDISLKLMKIMPSVEIKVGYGKNLLEAVKSSKLML